MISDCTKILTTKIVLDIVIANTIALVLLFHQISAILSTLLKRLVEISKRAVILTYILESIKSMVIY